MVGFEPPSIARTPQDGRNASGLHAHQDPSERRVLSGLRSRSGQSRDSDPARTPRDPRASGACGPSCRFGPCRGIRGRRPTWIPRERRPASTTSTRHPRSESSARSAGSACRAEACSEPITSPPAAHERPPAALLCPRGGKWHQRSHRWRNGRSTSRSSSRCSSSRWCASLCGGSARSGPAAGRARRRSGWTGPAASPADRARLRIVAIS